MPRYFSETAWKSEKVDAIKPVEWKPEYAWLYALSLADGTFEAAPKRVWSEAYSFTRADWDVVKVGRLLDELERVGLLIRRTDEHGKVWGKWVGAEKFLPSEARCKALRLKTGRKDLFEGAAATEQLRSSYGAATQQLRSSYNMILI
jgi:hypothetical protein